MNKNENTLHSAREETSILVAEDSPYILEFVCEVLCANDYKVICAVDGFDALEKFKEHRDKIQLYLTDVNMPRMNGKEAYNEIRKMKPDMKVLFMTSHLEDHARNNDLLGRDVEIITKPFKPEELLRRVKDALRRDDMCEQQ